jgi:hypothetical protein
MICRRPFSDIKMSMSSPSRRRALVINREALAKSPGQVGKMDFRRIQSVIFGRSVADGS